MAHGGVLFTCLKMLDGGGTAGQKHAKVFVVDLHGCW